MTAGASDGRHQEGAELGIRFGRKPILVPAACAGVMPAGSFRLKTVFWHRLLLLKWLARLSTIWGSSFGQSSEVLR